MVFRDSPRVAVRRRAESTTGVLLTRVRTPGTARLGLLFTYLACFTTPWNGLAAGGLRPGDLFIFLALLTLMLVSPNAELPRLPSWALGLAAAITVVTVMHMVVPTSARYLAERTVVDSGGNAVPEIQINWFVGAKYLVAVVGIAWMLGLAARYQVRSLKVAATAYAAGSAVSGFIGYTDGVGLTHMGVNSGDGRSTGLAVQSNFLAETTALSVPFALWLLASRRKADRLTGAVIMLGLLLGTYASGSRGGSVALVIAAAITMVAMPAYRRHMTTLALAAGLGAVLLFVTVPSVGQGLLRTLRLTGGASTTFSDHIRAEVAQQGARDFIHSPIDGVGMQVAAEAHNVYLQSLASGGLILFTGYVAFLIGSVLMARRAMRYSDLGAPLFAATASVAVLSMVENSLTDRLVYVPAGLVAGLYAVAPHLQRSTSTDEGEEDTEARMRVLHFT